MAEKEYIDRQSTVDALARLCKRVCQYSEKQRQYMCGACPLGDAFTVIEDDLPAADVRPVVRGKWIRMDMHKGMEQYKCAVCRSECYVPECMGEPMHAFCPNCGAMMEEI